MKSRQRSQGIFLSLRFAYLEWETGLYDEDRDLRR